MGKSNAVELGVDEVGEVDGGEEFESGAVGDAAFEVAVGAELEGGVEGGLADQYEVVIFGEVFEEEAKFTKGFDGDEVGVVDDGDWKRMSF